ncbi:hypothetical protein [Candidatus Protochlamydia phocaeensis]|uniref:hypothetical protein n=1 Tax=Candidatus Protochlamydia phocaeensis TaxID=1414722 RepID=UPI0008389848|nr:hypothetical protein [Candidatus Protochlamydia phocaeensis]
MNEHSHYRHFILTFFCLLGVAIPLIIAFNWAIDPYGIFNSPQLNGLNTHKPQAEQHVRLIKALEVEKAKPKVILLGSSRTRAGMHGEDLKDLTPYPALNVGLPAATIEELYAYLEHALYNQPDLKEVIMDVDLFMFNRNRKINPEYDSKRLKTNSMILDDYIGSLFTAHALKNSFLTLAENVQRQYWPFQEGKEIALNSHEINEEDKRFLKDILISHEWYGKFEMDSKQVESFAQIVQKCQNSGVQLKVYFPPAQAVYWEAIYQKGLGPSLENLKMTLCQIHPFYDFSGYNPVTMQQCQQISGPLYLDCSHFTRPVGQMILTKLYDRPVEIDHFGILVTPKTIASHLNQMRQEREAWIATHRDQASYIAELEQKAKPVR